MLNLIYIKLAWRNTLRNTRRTLIAGLAVGIGLAALIYVDALMIGMEKNMLDAATSSFLGEGQIHGDEFRTAGEVELTVKNLQAVTAALDDDLLVAHYTRRVLSFCMIGSAANANAVSLIGIDPEHERPMSEIDEALVAGAYLSGDGERQILIGRKLAELLEVDLGDRVVLTTAQAHTGDLAQEMFRVSGIFFFNTPEMDQYMVFVHLATAQEMLALGDDVHEVALGFTDRSIGRNAEHPFWGRYSVDGNEAVGWTILMPQLEAAFEMASNSKYIVGLILFAVVALGIVNTLFMSLYERMFEFGVMRAVGTQPGAMGRLVVFEAGALGIVSVAIGLVLGWILVYVVSQTGIDYGGIEYAGVTFRKLLYPVLEVRQFIEYPIWVFVFTLLIALYPAVYAARLTPAKAMRKSF